MRSSSDVERARRSRRVTTTTSSARSSLSRRSSTGRFLRAPEIFSSNSFSQPGLVEAGALDGELLVGRGHARVAELHAPDPTALRILLQKAFISQIYYANDKSLFLHPAIVPRNTLEMCECRRASGADTLSRHGTAAFPRPSRAENSGLCATPIPNRTFATPYVSRPFLSHARSYTQGPRSFFRLHEKGGRYNVVPAHHTAQAYVGAYLEAAGIGEDRRGPLFRSCEPGRRDALQDRAMSRLSALKMIKRRADRRGSPPRSAPTASAAPGSPSTCETAATSRSRHGSRGTSRPAPRSSTIACRKRSRSTEIERIHI